MTCALPASVIQRPDSLAVIISRVAPDRDYEWAWANYKRTVLELAKELRLTGLIEIGGGRDPLLTCDECGANGLNYTVNDISTIELAKAPAWTQRACFDVSGSCPPMFMGQYDFVFSRMVMEHVSDGERAYRNVYSLLRPGGVALSFMPTLWAPPFIANWLLPEQLSGRILRWMFPNRTDDGTPKFPARYSWCVSTRRLDRMLREIGYSEVVILPFYGHGYYSKIPILRDLSRVVTGWLRRHDVRLLSSFAYVIARKCD